MRHTDVLLRKEVAVWFGSDQGRAGMACRFTSSPGF